MRSDKERIARSTRHTAKEAAKQTDLLAQIAAQGPAAAPAAPAAQTPQQRLASLDDLRAQGVITDAEHAQARHAILTGQ
ncbi:hypothetical protein ABLG96_05345 [Nakamurella sp. A5-74]|uniref:SHOCT domain-containing protein n=1 Tax=Nakamurella sp. A5-74 TaxID=3158264 RepID=A0AAU8DRW8_9ACTN